MYPAGAWPRWQILSGFGDCLERFCGRKHLYILSFWPSTHLLWQTFNLGPLLLKRVDSPCPEPLLTCLLWEGLTKIGCFQCRWLIFSCWWAVRLRIVFYLLYCKNSLFGQNRQLQVSLPDGLSVLKKWLLWLGVVHCFPQVIFPPQNRNVHLLFLKAH